MSHARRVAIIAVVLAPLFVSATSGREADSRMFEIQVPGGALSIRLEEPERLPARGTLTEWLEAAALSLSELYGTFPVQRTVVRIKPRDSDSSPVSYGRVRRVDPPEVHFYVDPDASLEALHGDWTAVHEFSHLLVPFSGNRDIWFAEGLASYYQYVLRARGGLIEPETAWRRLAAGFRRGEDQPAGRGMPLRELAPRMWELRAHRRVYWTGAAYFLRVDLRLRQETDGRHSLETALHGFQRCCLDEDQRWNARRLIDTLDELTGTGVFRQEYRRLIDAPAEPDYADAFQALGIQLTGDGIDFSDAPDKRALRRAIMAGNG